MHKTAIFDLDGTLLYTLEDLKNSVNYALLQYSCPPRTLEEVRKFVGNGVRLLMERAMPQGSANPNFEECLSCFKSHYAKNMYNKTAPFDGINEMLDILKSRGYKIAVVSNKFDTAVKELCQKYFDNRVEVAIGENEAAGIHKKPAPDSVFRAMELLNSDKNLTYYIGDSEVDIQTAKNSGLQCISVSWGYKDREFLLLHDAQVIIDSPGQILEYLK